MSGTAHRRPTPLRKAPASFGYVFDISKGNTPWGFVHQGLHTLVTCVPIHLSNDADLFDHTTTCFGKNNIKRTGDKCIEERAEIVGLFVGVCSQP